MLVQQAEADGDIVGAEAILVDLLTARPGSLSAWTRNREYTTRPSAPESMRRTTFVWWS